ILDLAHPITSQEPSYQNVRVGEVQLLGRPLLIGRSHAIATPAADIEDRGKNARGVKARAAIPVDRSVSPDKSNAMQVANEPMIGDREITTHPAYQPSLRA